MFQITTKRLRLLPLSYENLLLMVEDRAQMEINLGLEPSSLAFHGEFKELRDETFAFWLENGQNENLDYRWCTNWELILTEENRSIGGLSFLGGPSSKGEVYLGFIILKEFRQHGYMTEAVEAISNWALEQEGVKKVISFFDGNLENKAVEKMLLKSGFRKETIFVKDNK